MMRQTLGSRRKAHGIYSIDYNIAMVYGKPSFQLDDTYPKPVDDEHVALDCVWGFEDAGVGKGETAKTRR